MARETIVAEVFKTPPPGSLFGGRDEDPENVQLYVKTSDGNETAISTGVNKCDLKDGDKVVATLDEGIPLPGTFLTQSPAPEKVWGDACAFCKYNPYLGKSTKQCEACQKPISPLDLGAAK